MKVPGDHDLVDSLGGGTRDCHGGGVLAAIVGRVYLVVQQVISWTQHHVGLEFVQLSLAGLSVTNEIDKASVVCIQDAELLVERMLDRVLLLEGVVVQNGHRVGHSSLQRL